MKFPGHERPDGSVGIRNYVGVLPASLCANTIAMEIASGIENVIALPHNGRCTYLGEDEDIFRRALVGIGNNPNIGAVLIVGVGCELLTSDIISKEIGKTGKLVDFINVEDDKGVKQTIIDGKLMVKRFKEKISEKEKKYFEMNKITIGIKCGGSDATSGIAGNVVAGKLADKIIKLGGKFIFTETAEMIGAENLLVKRARNSLVKEKIYKIINDKEKSIKSMGVDLTGRDPTPGNIQQGLTTIEEKALGAVVKGGNSIIQDVLEWGEKPTESGLYIMDGSPLTILACVGFAAAGAQIMLFSIGNGLPARVLLPAFTGSFPIMPIVKLTGNPINYKRDKEFFDIHVGSVIVGEESIDQAAERAFNELYSYISGDKKPILDLINKDFVWPMDFYTKGLVV